MIFHCIRTYRAPKAWSSSEDRIAENESHKSDFFCFFSILMFAVFRLLPPQGGESVAPYQAFGAHPLMQIPETLHIMHCSKSLYTNITPFFSALQAGSSDSANDTKNAPISCYGNRGDSIALFVFFQALTQNLAGVLDSSLSGCQNYRAFATVICRFFNTLYLQRTASLY